jgi:RHS repeat-associated protein
MTAIATATGAVQERYTYSAYGQPVMLSAAFVPLTAPSGLPTSAFDWESLYCGYRYEAKTGLFHIRHRVYHPGVGVWLQRDPLGISSGINLYAYCDLRPLQLTDSHGLLSAAVGGGISLGNLGGIPIGNLLSLCLRVPHCAAGLALVSAGLLTYYLLTTLRFASACSITYVAADVTARCTFNLAWCLWGREPANNPGAGWSQNAPCMDCMRECISAGGIWSFGRCPLGNHGPRWRGPDDSVLPPGWEWVDGMPVRA